MTTEPCCHLDHDRDGNCPRHPAEPVRATRITAVDAAPGTHATEPGKRVKLEQHHVNTIARAFDRRSTLLEDGDT